MKVAVIRFPGSNCDQDAFYALNDDLKVKADYVWYEETSLTGFDAVFLPGGFAYGDYLRCGAMAARAPVMEEVQRFVRDGRPVIGVCNGFQVLCEAGILPGALLPNASQQFVCKHILLKAENRASFWTQGVDKLLKIPVAHGEGQYICSDEVLKGLEGEGLVAFRYVDEMGRQTQESNPNGSICNIAGVVNKKGNVLGLMPHPERATKKMLGSTDGMQILKALVCVGAGL